MMRDRVRGKRIHDVSGSGESRAELRELAKGEVAGEAVDFGDGGAGAREGECVALDVEDGLVEVALGGGEGAVDGEGARDVGGVVRVLAGGVDEDEGAFSVGGGGC